jgi:hypothetical protein
VSTNRRQIISVNDLLCKNDRISAAPTNCRNERTEILVSVDLRNLISIPERRVREIENHPFGRPD